MNLFHRLKTIHQWQMEIQENEVGTKAIDGAERLKGVVCGRYHLYSLALRKKTADGTEEDGRIVHDHRANVTDINFHLAPVTIPPQSVRAAGDDKIIQLQCRCLLRSGKAGAQLALLMLVVPLVFER